MNTASRMNYFFSSIGKKHLPVLLACLGGAAAVYAASMTQEGVQYDSNYASDRAQIEDLQARYLFAPQDLQRGNGESPRGNDQPCMVGLSTSSARYG